MKFRTFILMGILHFAMALNAQTVFKPGYVIHNNGDTITGQIDYRGDLRMHNFCTFKDNDNNVVEFGPTDIAGYRFTEGRYFVSRELDANSMFFEFLIQGEINIYYLRTVDGDRYYIDKDGQRLLEIPYEKGVVYVDGKQYEQASKKHIGVLSYYMQDAPGFESKIQSIREPNHKNLIKLAKDYHNTVCFDEQCIIFNTKQPKVKIYLEPTLRMIRIETPKFYSEWGDDRWDSFGFIDKKKNIAGYPVFKYHMQGGVLAHLSLPRSNPKLYLTTGFLLSRLEYDIFYYNNFTFTSDVRYALHVPIKATYIYPKGIIRPRTSYGLMVRNPMKLKTTSWNLGANIKLSEKLFLSATTDIYFNSKVIIPTSKLAHSFNLGIYMHVK